MRERQTAEVWCVCVKSAEVGFNIKFKRCVLHLFFFLNFGLNRWFQPIRPELARFSANQPKSEPHWRESAKKKKNP